MDYFTSDLHFNHNKEFMYAPRGFKSIEEHDAVIINNINSLVKSDDNLYILGDLCMGNMEENRGSMKLGQINCRNVYFIIGNHDGTTKLPHYEIDNGFTNLGYAYPFTYKKIHFLLSHYPTLTANADDKDNFRSRVYNICGHSHQNNVIDPITNSYHVELDAHKNFPVSIEQIVNDLKFYYGV